MRTFRNDRIALIASGQMPIPMQAGAKIALHLIPESAFELGKKCDLKKENVSNAKLIGTDYRTDGRYNFDGYTSYHKAHNVGEAKTYTQVFHNGIIEAADVDLLNCTNGGQPWSYFRQEVVVAFDSLIQTQSAIGVDFPVWAGLSLLDVRGYKFSLQDRDKFSITCSPIDQDELIIPEAYVEHSGLSGNEALRASFDRILNACGLEGMSECG